jgi:energy-coupling factor transporter transmembrane protein EcfT
MNLSKREQDLLRRGLDKATTPDEAETAAKNFFKELRKRGVDGYKFEEAANTSPPKPPPPPTWTPPPQPPPPTSRGWEGYRPGPPAQKSSNGAKSWSWLLFIVTLALTRNFFVALFMSWIIGALFTSGGFRLAVGRFILGLVGLFILVGVIAGINKSGEIARANSYAPVTYPSATPFSPPAENAVPDLTPEPTPTPSLSARTPQWGAAYSPDRSYKVYHWEYLSSGRRIRARYLGVQPTMGELPNDPEFGDMWEVPITNHFWIWTVPGGWQFAADHAPATNDNPTPTPSPTASRKRHRHQ